MYNQYFNFYYSPEREGYDTKTWKTLTGTPTITSNKLVLSSSAMVHWGDITRGDATFNINIASPVTGASKKIGFYQPSKNSFACFSIVDDKLYATCSDGENNTTTEEIAWQSIWTSADTNFRVQWEAGQVHFYIGDVHQMTISDNSVTGSPMSLYAIEQAGDSSITLNYIDVQTVQSYFNGYSPLQPFLLEGLLITENVTVSTPA